MYIQNIICDYCGGEHAYSDCPANNWFYQSFEQTNFVDDFYRHPNNPYLTLITMRLITLNGVINPPLQSSKLKKRKMTLKN